MPSPQEGVPPPTVFFCILTERCVYDMAFLASMRLMYFATKAGYTPIYQQYNRTDITRQALAMWFLKRQGGDDDVLVMLDIDHDHPPRLIEQLVSRDVDVCVPMMFRRGPGYELCAFVRNGDGGLHHLTSFTDGLVKVQAVGSGAIAIKRRALKKLYDAGHRVFFKYEYEVQSDEGVSAPSEDLYFSKICEKEGVEMYVDMTIQTPHISYGLIDKQTYEDYRKDNPEPEMKVGIEVRPTIERK